MDLRKVNLVVIGHKDHGKSTLIGRLLYDSGAIPEQKLQEIREEIVRSGRGEFKYAFLLDTLEEERKGGLTIDIVQTPFKTKKRLFTIIDCPGHKEFIKNMITGASQADAAILLVSAKEGIQDQTKQHLFLTKTLGIDQLIIAVSKMDEVKYDEKRYEEISKKLEGVLNSLGYRRVPKIPVSALNGDNVLRRSNEMQWYGGLTLTEALDRTNPSVPPTNKPLRGSVQDVYKIAEGKIVVCKIESGILESNRAVIIEPSGERGVIKKIEMFGRELRRAEPGDSVGLIMDGIKEVERGEVISYPEAPAKLIRSFLAEIILFSDITIRNQDVVVIRYGTAEKECKVQRILERNDPINLTLQERFPKILKEGEIGKVRFTAFEPLCIEKYSDIPQMGRFVVEGKRGTAAAGIVTEVQET